MHDSSPVPTPKVPAPTPPAGLRRAGFVGALVLGLTGVLSGAAAAPAGAAETFPGGGSGQQAQPDGRGGGEYWGGSRGRGGGHGHGHGGGNGHGRDRTVDYVAFGDSFAAGVGGGPALDTCGRTAEGYPSLLDALPRVELDSNQSCTGATALSTPPPPPAVDLPEQISAAVAGDLLTERTDLVTVTISGNDVLFGSVAAACAGPVLPAACTQAIAAAQEYAETAVVPQLQASFAAIEAASPRAELVVVGYPHLFEGTTPGALSIEAQNLFNAGTDMLNALVAGQVGDGTFVDVTEIFTGHGLGSADSWIVPPGEPFALHPNAAGYREGYLEAITESVDLLDRDGHGRGGCRGR